MKLQSVLINNQDVEIHAFSAGSHPCPKCQISVYLKGRLILGPELNHDGLCHRPLLDPTIVVAK